MREGLYHPVVTLIREMVDAQMAGESTFEQPADLIGVIRFDLRQVLDNVDQIVYDEFIRSLESE